jgi:hypothetical protein
VPNSTPSMPAPAAGSATGSGTTGTTASITGNSAGDGPVLDDVRHH